MYLNCRVRVPEAHGKLTTKRIKNTPYIYFEYAREYDRKKKYNSAKRVCIGKACEDQTGMMIPNTNFLRYFPEAGLPEEAGESERSSCLRVGAYFVIRKVMDGYFLDRTIAKIIGKDAGLFLDLAVYSILTEGNAAQYYPDYAYNHPLLTENMKIYSDSKISDFLNQDMTDKRIGFLNEWNRKRDRREKIYISYDSTNKNCQAGDVELAEMGHAKDDESKPVINYSIAYDRNNEEPLFYEAYPGSVVDISQLQFMLDKAKAYGYQHVGFILDRGYFGKGNIHFMDRNGYDFVIMVKGMKRLVREVILSVIGTFEQGRENSIRSFKVNGITVPHQLYPSDEKQRYFHIFYSDRKHTLEREKFEEKIDRMARQLKAWRGEQVRPAGEYKKYFDLIYYHEGKDDESFMGARELTDVINQEIRLCGYFAIITSEKMTAEEALTLYKSRDGSEKLFRGDKSFLGDRAERVYGNESVDTKIFIEFVALILRNRIYTCLKKEMQKKDQKQNFMTVPAALRELEKIEMIRNADNEYHLDHAVTATQKAILAAFDMTAQDIKRMSRDLGVELARIEQEQAEKKAAQASQISE